MGVIRTTIQRQQHAGGDWLLATRASAPAVGDCVPQYVGYEERTLLPTQRLKVPHPNITVIVNLGAPLDVRAPALAGRGGTYGSFVAGLFDTSVITTNTGDSSGIEMKMSPLAVWRLLGVPMDEFTNRIVSVDELLGRDAARLEEQLRGLATWDARFDLLDATLARRLAACASPPAEVVWACEQLARPCDALPVSAVARELQWSRRRLGVAFREHVGLTPKAFARVARFDRAVRQVREGSLTRWSTLAFECGYADQSHLTREFREFAGVSPGEFVRRQGSDMTGVAAA